MERKGIEFNCHYISPSRRRRRLPPSKQVAV
jgi:hypothetical protein